MEWFLGLFQFKRHGAANIRLTGAKVSLERTWFRHELMLGLIVELKVGRTYSGSGSLGLTWFQAQFAEVLQFLHWTVHTALFVTDIQLDNFLTFYLTDIRHRHRDRDLTRFCQ